MYTLSWRWRSREHHGVKAVNNRRGIRSPVEHLTVWWTLFHLYFLFIRGFLGEGQRSPPLHSPMFHRSSGSPSESRLISSACPLRGSGLRPGLCWIELSSQRNDQKSIKETSSLTQWAIKAPRTSVQVPSNCTAPESLGFVWQEQQSWQCCCLLTCYDQSVFPDVITWSWAAEDPEDAHSWDSNYEAELEKKKCRFSIDILLKL